MRIISEHKNAGRFALINWRHKVRRHTEHAYVLDVLHKEKTAHMCDLHNFLLSQYTRAYEVKEWIDAGFRTFESRNTHMRMK